MLSWWVPLPHGRTVLLRVSPSGWSGMGALPGNWLYVSGEAVSGYSACFDAAPTVVVNHNLGRRPASVCVRTMGGVEVDVATVHLNQNQTLLQFDVLIPGTVEIS